MSHPINFKMIKTIYLKMRQIINKIKMSIRKKRDSNYFSIKPDSKRGYASLCTSELITSEYRERLEDPVFRKSEKNRKLKLFKNNELVIENLIGKKGGDIIYHGLSYLFSESFVNLLKNNNIRGFKKYLIHVKSKNELPNYYYLEPKNTANFVSKNNISTYSKVYAILSDFDNENNIYFYRDDLTEIDFFTVSDTGVIVVSKRVKDLVEKNNLKNIIFEPIYEF